MVSNRRITLKGAYLQINNDTFMLDTELVDNEMAAGGSTNENSHGNQSSGQSNESDLINVFGVCCQRVASYCFLILIYQLFTVTLLPMIQQHKPIIMKVKWMMIIENYISLLKKIIYIIWIPHWISIDKMKIFSLTVHCTLPF